MDEFVTEFDLTNQQIVLLNDIDDVSAPRHSDLNCLMNSPANINYEYEPFSEIQNPESNSDKNRDCFDATNLDQFHITKNRNGNRYMKFKKPKKVKKRLVDQEDHRSTIKVKTKRQNNQHMKKEYQCEVCMEEFNVLENLTLHTSLHLGDGRCPQCGKIFRRLASLEGHIKSHFKSEFLC